MTAPGLARAANALWIASCLPAAAKFHLSKRNVARAQEQVLGALLRRNAGSSFGRARSFASIRTIHEFQQAVPLAGYDELRAWIGRIEAGEEGVLTRERVLLLEPTSGSASASKLIPCTASLKSEFSRAVAPWMVSLAAHDPRLLAGRAYWSLSPLAARDRRSAGGVPIGFEQDAEYFGRAQSFLIRAIQAVPPEVRLIQDAESFRYATLLFLLRANDLALISVWSPSFALVLLRKLPAWLPRLADDIASGTLSIELETTLHASLRELNRPDKRRAAQVRDAFQKAAAGPSLHARLWPRLRLISCWDSAQAAADARELAAQFPQARLQGKGLLATEGIVSLPLHARAGAALAIGSHFFEFLPARFHDGQLSVEEAPLLAHQLERGARYAVVMTTGGGLYRYKLQDVVEVAGFDAQCPLLRFVGRADRVSDLRGEKLHEEHVSRALQVLVERHGINTSFLMLAPESYHEGGAVSCAYTLFIESDASLEVLKSVARELEEALRESFHYDLCRRLEQLGATRVFRIQSHARESYVARCVEMGQREGDVKPCALHLKAGWAAIFSGHLH